MSSMLWPVIGLSILAGLARGQYLYIEIPLLPNTIQGAALGVNDAGDVVGWCRASNNMHYGFLYEHDTGAIINLGPLGTTAAGYPVGARSINNNREVVGVWGCNCAGGVRAFYWNPDTGFLDISFQPRPQDVINSAAYAINRHGQVGGWNKLLCPDINAAANAAAIWTDPTDPHTPPTPVFPSDFACGIGGFGLGINDFGAVCGWNQILENNILWTRATLAGSLLPTFSPAHGGNSEALDVNNLSIACGYSEDRSGTTLASSACYWILGGQIQRLDGIPASTDIFARALALNDTGDIVGSVGPQLNSRAALWASLSQTPIDLNTTLLNPLAQGNILFTAEDISNAGYIVGRLNQGANSRPYLLVPCAALQLPSPHDAVVCATGSVEFSVSLPIAATFQWQANVGSPDAPIWCSLVDGIAAGGCEIPQSQAFFTGTATDTLTITSLRSADQRQYRCIATTPCATLTSQPASLTLCRADLNCDGVLSFFDISAFLNAYSDQLPLADFDGDLAFTFFDVQQFLAAYSQGCP